MAVFWYDVWTTDYGIFYRQVLYGGLYKDAFTSLAPYFVSSLKLRSPLRFFMKKETLRCCSRESIASRL